MTLSLVRRRRSPVAAVVLAALVASGCYHSVPVQGAPALGTEVVVEMTSDATERLGGFLGRGTVDLRGRLLAWEQDSVVLSMIASEDTRGAEQLWQGERVAVPRGAVARVRERRLQRGRTAALAAGIGTLVVTGIIVSTRGEGGASGGGTKPAPQ